MGLKLVERGVGLFSTIILARILTPNDFGLVAMAVAVVALLELMSAFGFDTALIQRQQTGRAHYDTAWTFNVIFGSAIAVLLLVVAVPAAAFYREPRLELILPVLAISSVVGGFANIGTVAFRKELDFKSEFRFQIAKRMATFVVTIGLALTLRSYWALIAGVVVGTLVSVWISYRLHPFRPRFSLAARDDLFHFSKWIFVSSFVQFLRSRSTDFILGRTVGSHGLGIYNVAVEIASLPATELIAPLNRSVFPAYARLSDDPDQLAQRFGAVFGMICFIGFPVSLGILCVAEPAVALLLGSQWTEAVPIIQIVALSGLATALQSNLYIVLLALGKPRAFSLLSAGVLLVSLPVTVVACMRFGTTGAAAAHCFASVLGLVAIRVLFTRLSGVPFPGMGKYLLRPLVASTLMVGAVLTTYRWFLEQSERYSTFAELVSLCTIGALVYALAILALWAFVGRPDSTERKILELLRSWIMKRTTL